MSIKGWLGKQSKLFVKHIKSTIKPPATVLPKDRFPRDENHYHYRYPSPASYDVPETPSNAYDYRLGYQDSIHNIRAFDYDHRETDDTFNYMMYTPDAGCKEKEESSLKRNQRTFIISKRSTGNRQDNERT